jgi:hypothetical protein
MGCRSIVRLRLSIIGVECGMWNVRDESTTKRGDGRDSKRERSGSARELKQKPSVRVDEND